jgi:hypothetical protein
MGIKAIVRELSLARETVRRFARAQNVQELLATAQVWSRPSVLDPFTDHLHQRWNEGYTCATQLFAEIQALGYRGTYATLRSYLRPFRAAAGLPPASARPPKVRHIAGWIKLNDIRSRCGLLLLDNPIARHHAAASSASSGRSLLRFLLIGEWPWSRREWELRVGAGGGDPEVEFAFERPG